MLKTIWAGGSLRLWLFMAIMIAVTPLAVSAVLGYAMINNGVIASYNDMVERHRLQLDPAHQLRLELWSIPAPLDDFVEDGGQKPITTFQHLRSQIEVGFADLHVHLTPQQQNHLESASKDWMAADQLAAKIMSDRPPPGDPRAAAATRTFHGLIANAIDKVGDLIDAVDAEIHADHAEALHAYDRAENVAIIAAILSALGVLIGIVAIGRMLAVSVDRLVEGARRFAAGDREHRIEVRIPPELQHAATEFNRMIRRINETEKAMEDLAHRDGLTQLLNRRAFDEALLEGFARVQRHGERLALLMLDIDHFKKINDTYGHSAGDDVLRNVARTLASDVRVFDRAFRVGGEEFAILLSGTDAVAARQTAERLRANVAAKSTTIDGGEVSVTISIGIATAAQAPAPAALVKAADAALYQAKRDGRNRVVVSDDAASPTDSMSHVAGDA